MDKGSVRVLLIGESENGFSSLFRWLEEQECLCEFASSYGEGVRLFADQPFDVVLCSGQPGIRTLFPSVVASRASLFCAHAIEDSCLWVPVILRGEECLGRSPLRPREFAGTLQRIVEELKSSASGRAARRSKLMSLG